MDLIATNTFDWECIPYDEAVATHLAASLNVPAALAKVLAGRGIRTEAEAHAFLNPSLSQLTDPFLLPGVADAVKRILAAIEKHERIVIYGDYDCDGVTATVLLVQVLRQFGAEVAYFIPKRAEDGYGFTLGALDKVLEDYQPQLIITADCGMRSADAVAVAAAAGVDVVIIDHHQPYGAPVPDAAAVVSSVLPEAPEAMKPLASVGLAFTLCRALQQAAIAARLAGADAIDIYRYLDLVTIGTVTDLMLLRGDNRMLVHYGLALLNDVSKRTPGIVALIRAAGLRTEIGSYEVGFLIGPRLSAAGRVGNADVAVGLLLEPDAMEARRKAGQLDACYRERRRVEESVMQSALTAASHAIETGEGAIIAVGANWHIGTIGIVAARISGRYHRPTVVISCDADGNARGSCRSIPGLDLEKVFMACAKHLVAYGGHDFTAGFSLQREAIPEFCKAFQTACRKWEGKAVPSEHGLLDGWISFSETDDALLDSIKQLQPLGLGNQTPVWGARNVRIQGPVRIVGGNHLKLTLVSGGTEHDAIGYGLGDRKIPQEPLDVIFQLQRNHFKGRSMLQLSIKDFRTSDG